MSNTNTTGARAVADLAEGELLASVVLAVPPERVFRALVSEEITNWWIRPGVFDTREWSGDVRVGGRWRAAGLSRGEPYVLEGEFLEIELPRKVVHTLDGAGSPQHLSTVTYLLEPAGEGTRLTLRQTGFLSRDRCEAFAIGWETSFERLAQILAPELSRVQA
jgi:uncharacterized protein YndB with AHSA1/START domain